MSNLAELIGRPGLAPGVELLQAKAVSVPSGGKVTIHFGDATATIAGVPMLNGVVVANGDTVWVLRSAGILLVVGAIGPSLLMAPSHIFFGTFSSGFTNSSSFVTMPGTPSRTVTKLRADTVFNLVGRWSAYKTVNPGTVDLAMNFNGADYWIGRFFFNTLGQHNEMAVVGNLGGAPAGTYTVTLKWRTGTGDVSVDSNDLWHIALTEGYAV